MFGHNVILSAGQNIPGQFSCSVDGCPYFAEVGHSCCCRRCRATRGKAHGRNCTQHVRGIIQHIAPSSAQQHIASMAAGTTPSPRGECMNMAFPFYRPPQSHYWDRGVDDLMTFLQWYNGNGIKLPDAWNKLAWLLEASHIRKDRNLEIHALPEVVDFVPYANLGIRVHALDARDTDAYNLSTITGIHWRIIATLLKQETAANILIDTVLQVESFNLSSLAYICQGGTHRSVAMSYLLMILVYRQAYFQPHTARVNSAIRVALRPRGDEPTLSVFSLD